MSTLRKDPVTGNWVIIAEGRSLRPSDFGAALDPNAPSRDLCPFCEGREGETPKEVAAMRPEGAPPDAPGWSIRVVPNKYAVLDMRQVDLVHVREGLFEEMNGMGEHEVVIETPDHDARMESYSPEKLTALLRMFRERAIHLHELAQIRHVQIFRNFGSRAGASLEHPHTQIVALPVAPRWVESEFEGARRHFRERARCLFCDLLGEELHDGARIVAENEKFVAFCPYASRAPYELWILPRRHGHDFRYAGEDELPALAQLLRRCLGALARALGEPPYNLMIQSAREDEAGVAGARFMADEFHWHVEIVPRVAYLAGLEWGTGFFINTLAPERAAETMRSLLDDAP